MSDESESTSSLKVTDAFGPQLAAVLAQAITAGVIMGQMSTFWSLSSPSGSALRGSNRHDVRAGLSVSYPYVRVRRRVDRLRLFAGWLLENLRAYPSEKRIIRLLALFVVSLTIVHHIFSLLHMWHVLVESWGNMLEGLQPTWASNLTLLLVRSSQNFLIRSTTNRPFRRLHCSQHLCKASSFGALISFVAA